MRKTLTRITCDICYKEIGPHEGLSQFVTERLDLIKIEMHSDDVEHSDICQRCSDSILEKIQSLAGL